MFLGPTLTSKLLNQVIDPAQHRFKVVQRFDFGPKPGILQPTGVEELTALPSTNGNFALFEFTGALPKLQLYSTWEIKTNAEAILQRLVSPEFEPLKTVVISEAIKTPPAANATNDTAGYSRVH